MWYSYLLNLLNKHQYTSYSYHLNEHQLTTYSYLLNEHQYLLYSQYYIIIQTSIHVVFIPSKRASIDDLFIPSKRKSILQYVEALDDLVDPMESQSVDQEDRDDDIEKTDARTCSQVWMPVMICELTLFSC